MEPVAPAVPVVCIGASAGGLEPIEAFLGRVSLPAAAAYVVIQHLDPTHPGVLAGLLARVTVMPVDEARDRTVVVPGHVYVIPPGRELRIERGRLRVAPAGRARAMRLPIDDFLRSLAHELGPRAAGVILSGMGSDGTLGLRELRDAGGLTLAQAPETAAFDAMPRSAIAAGVVDVVAPVDELPGRIDAFLGASPRGVVPADEGPVAGGDALARILEVVRRRTGSDFMGYKRSTVVRRLERRMAIHGVTGVDAYLPVLLGNPDEAALLFRELLVGVTSFFRDRATWERLAADVLPGLFASRSGDRSFRAWVPACSTGEEAYSLAITVLETLERLEPRWDGTIRIFATDIDPEAIDRARQGRYSGGIAADVSPERLRRWFVQEDGTWRIGKEVRSLVVFATHDVTRDPSFTKLDLVSCRNLLIYLGADLQEAVLGTFHYALDPGGVLLLGGAETAGSQRLRFEHLPGKDRVYRRLTGLGTLAGAEWTIPAPLDRSRPAGIVPVADPAVTIRDRADRLLLERFTPAAVVTTAEGDIVYINGRTGDYLEPAAGSASWNILAMARDGLRIPLGTAFRTAMAGRTAVTLRSLEVVAGGVTHRIDVTVAPVTDPGPLEGMAVIAFVPGGPAVARRRRTAHAGGEERDRLADDLRRVGEELDATRREMQAAVEALTSANEELQSTNEELQSTNEELTTSKEEMQSMNEELQVVNAELHARLEELTLANSDMENLLDTTELATVFLDRDRAIRRFTPTATSLFHLIPGDVGRPLGDITTELDYPELAADTAGVLRTLRVRERDVAAHDGRRFDARIVPYRTASGLIDGVVLTFTDTTAIRRLEAALAATGTPPPTRDEPGRRP